MIMGFDRAMSGPRMVSVDSSSGDAARDGPLGDEVRDRWRAGVDLDAFMAKADARSVWWTMAVRSDRRDVRLGLESTRWNSCFSCISDSPLSVAESSQSDESSSSMALSETSSSSSEYNAASSSCVPSLMVLVATTSLNEVCFLLCIDRLDPLESELRCGSFDFIELSNELSSSVDDSPPSMNLGVLRLGSSARESTTMGCDGGGGASWVCDLYDEIFFPGVKPRTTL